MKKLLTFIAILIIVSCQSADEKHFITDADYRQEVMDAFEQTKKLAVGRNEQLFKVFDENLSLEEKEALQFLYAYMPLSDLSNYNGDFFLNNVRLAFTARDTFAWGKDIPEDVFRHFVLPYRINNENMDSSRAVFLNELYPRIKDMDIENAALEINHWCHEKVNYKATDSRTMSPLGVIKTAYGRCGEESTFTVTAMRAAGIPARQVYTPRWAHTDDNHAWVEVYVNGTWKFLGACEPAPALNMGWFDAAVLRAMMVHTKVFGKYKGSEKVIRQQKQFSELNLLSNYVQVKDIFVKVKNTDNKTISGAYVEFGLYNYSEFYPLKKTYTDENGLLSLTTGHGTLRIFASKGEYFNTKMVDIANVDTLEIVLDKKVGETFSENVDYIAPIAKIPKTLDIDQTLNDKRFKQEDSIREEYIATFYTVDKSRQYAQNLNLDTAVIIKIMPEARGNYPQIETYIDKTLNLKHDKQLKLLEVINPKDLHDISADILINHLQNFTLQQDYPDEIVDNYILNPRIHLEMISPYRDFLQQKFENILAKNDIKQTANSLKNWISENIKIENERNYYNVILLPQGVYELKYADKLSRDIFFVAVMRSLGFPARIEEANQKLQYWDNNKWYDIKFDDNANEENIITEQAFVSFNNLSKIELQYRVHFALAKFEDNKFRTIELGWDKKLKDFEAKTILEPGYYQLITGNRMQNGNVLVNQSYFNIEPNETKVIDLNLREKIKNSEPVCTINIKNLDNIKVDSLKVFAWINPNSEPGKHFIAEYSVLEKEFKQQNISMTLFVKYQSNKKDLQTALGLDLDIKIDENFGTKEKISQQCSEIKPDRLPLFIILSSTGDLLYLSQGYNIGVPEQIIKNYVRIKN